MQQALDYAVTLNIPFVFSSNGDGFVFHDRTGASMEKEATLSLDAFPSPNDLWSKYRACKGLTPDEKAIVLQDYFEDGSGKGPRYYHLNGIINQPSNPTDSQGFNDKLQELLRAKMVSE